jgi:hypothetical protein
MTPPDYIFCGSAWPITDPFRHMLWVDFNRKLFPCSKLVILNDGADLGHWRRSDVQAIYLEPHLGRISNLDHNGLFRSMLHMCNWMSGTKKLIWLEWDFYIISQRCIDWVCSVNQGLKTVWCPQHNFPESSLMIICQDQYDSFRSFMCKWIESPKGIEFERSIPFTEVKRDFIGDRRSDFGAFPQWSDDYSAQTTRDMAELFVNSIRIE